MYGGNYDLVLVLVNAVLTILSLFVGTLFLLEGLRGGTDDLLLRVGFRKALDDVMRFGAITHDWNPPFSRSRLVLARAVSAETARRPECRDLDVDEWHKTDECLSSSSGLEEWNRIEYALD